jgi:hypothetical protein
MTTKPEADTKVVQMVLRLELKIEGQPHRPF